MTLALVLNLQPHNINREQKSTLNASDKILQICNFVCKPSM